MSALITGSGPCAEVHEWLRKNQDRLQILVHDKQPKAQEMPPELIATSNRFPNYHVVKSFVEDTNAKKRKFDRDSTFFDLPQDLGGETLRKGMTKLNQSVDYMVDSNALLQAGDAASLYQRFTEHGYLLFRGLLDKNDIMNARRVVLETLQELRAIDEEGNVLATAGWTVDTLTGELISGKSDFREEQGGLEAKWREACAHSSLLSIKQNNALKKAFTLLSQGKSTAEKCRYSPRTFAPHYSWLRVKATDEYTPVHADIFYYKVFSPDLSHAKYLSCVDVHQDVRRPRGWPSH